MDLGFIYVLIVAAVVVIGLAVIIRQMRQFQNDSEYLGRTMASVLRTQSEVAGRFDQLSADSEARQTNLSQSLKNQKSPK